MGVPNFMSMNFGMPMIVSRTYSQMAEEYMKEFGEELTIGMYEAYEQDDFEVACEEAETFTGKLAFHIVEAIGGRYDGFQFIVKERYEDLFDLNNSSAYCIDNENAHYYFDTCRSIALRKADAEKRKIERWLNKKAGNGYNRIACVGMFSNGEVQYALA